jgi:hypothetical protein
MNLAVYSNFKLDSEKLAVKKGLDKRTQLLFADIKYVSVLVDTAELLEYLENMTEQVRQINCEQNKREL